MVVDDIHPIFKILGNVLDGSSGIFGPRLFQSFQIVRTSSRFPDILFFQKGFGVFLDFLSILDTSEKTENHNNEGFAGFPKMNPQSY